MINLTNVSLLRGGNVLFAEVNAAFYKKHKIGIIGRNGTGKSSLFALILKQLDPDSGEITISDKTFVVHLEQEVPLGKQNCVQYVIDGDCTICCM